MEDKITSADWETIKNAIWKRDNLTCQICNKKLYEIYYPRDNIVNEIKELKQIPVYKWEWRCHACGKDTPVVTYDFCIVEDYCIGELIKLDKQLSEIYDFVDVFRNNGSGKEETLVSCVHCSVMQHTGFINSALWQMTSEDYDMTQILDTHIENNLTIDDLKLGEEAVKPRVSLCTREGHVHHLDTNRSHNGLSNLVLLCSTCHMKLHREN